MRLIFLFLTLLMPLSSAAAQEPVPAGARVRVTTLPPDGRIQIGTFQGLSGGAMQLRASGSLFTVPLSTVSRLELSTGRKASVPGGVVGGLLGAAAGGALGCLANRDDYGVFCGGQSDTKVAVGAILGAGAGAWIGAVLLRRERWRDVDLPAAR
jgi:hypothetical protein